MTIQDVLKEMRSASFGMRRVGLEDEAQEFTKWADAIEAEIAVLREDKERLMDRIDGCHHSMQEKDAEIERLWALFSHWYEMWNDGTPNLDGDVLDDTVDALAGNKS